MKTESVLRKPIASSAGRRVNCLPRRDASSTNGIYSIPLQWAKDVSQCMISKLFHAEFFLVACFQANSFAVWRAIEVITFLSKKLTTRENLASSQKQDASRSESFVAFCKLNPHTLDPYFPIYINKNTIIYQTPTRASTYSSKS